MPSETFSGTIRHPHPPPPPPELGCGAAPTIPSPPQVPRHLRDNVAVCCFPHSGRPVAAEVDDDHAAAARKRPRTAGVRRVPDINVFLGNTTFGSQELPIPTTLLHFPPPPPVRWGNKKCVASAAACVGEEPLPAASVAPHRPQTARPQRRNGTVAPKITGAPPSPAAAHSGVENPVPQSCCPLPSPQATCPTDYVKALEERERPLHPNSVRTYPGKHWITGLGQPPTTTATIAVPTAARAVAAAAAGRQEAPVSKSPRRRAVGDGEMKALAPAEDGLPPFKATAAPTHTKKKRELLWPWQRREMAMVEATAAAGIVEHEIRKATAQRRQAYVAHCHELALKHHHGDSRSGNAAKAANFNAARVSSNFRSSDARLKHWRERERRLLEVAACKENEGGAGGTAVVPAAAAAAGSSPIHDVPQLPAHLDGGIPKHGGSATQRIAALDLALMAQRAPDRAADRGNCFGFKLAAHAATAAPGLSPRIKHQIARMADLFHL